MPPVARVPCTTQRGEVLAQVERVGAGAGARDRRRERVAARREPVLEARRGRRDVSPAAKRPVGSPRQSVDGREDGVARLVAQRRTRRSGRRAAAWKRDLHARSCSGSPCASAVIRSPPSSSNHASSISRRGVVAVAAAPRRSSCDEPAEVELVVGARDRVRLADREHARRARAASRGRRSARPRVMSCVTKTIVLPSRLEPLELLEALLLERGVADGEHLVDQQHVGVDLDRDRERRAARSCPTSSS